MSSLTPQETHGVPRSPLQLRRGRLRKNRLSRRDQEAGRPSRSTPSPAGRPTGSSLLGPSPLLALHGLIGLSTEN